MWHHYACHATKNRARLNQSRPCAIQNDEQDLLRYFKPGLVPLLLSEVWNQILVFAVTQVLEHVHADIVLYEVNRTVGHRNLEARRMRRTEAPVAVPYV